jgi:ferritin-like metal-binding protein YciE
MADNENLHSLYIDQLRDLYSAERQILDALPKMIKRSTHRELTAALEDHRTVTERQVDRLEQIFTLLQEKPGGEKCEGIEGILKEGNKELHHWHDHAVLDAAIIASAQRVEHYEIAGYGTARSIAQVLGLPEHAAMLQRTLNEEEAADRALTGIADSVVNADALRASGGT